METNKKMEYNLKVNFYDCDPAGILFFANIMKYCHSAYEHFVNTNLPDYNFWNNSEVAFPIIHCSVDYKNTITYKDNLLIKIIIKEIKDHSFIIHYEIKNENDKLCAKCETVHVTVNKKDWLKTLIPENIKKILIEAN